MHAATSIGSGSPTYTAKYDALGDMTCRAPTSAAACTGTPTGAVLSYDNEGRLSAWQNAPSSPTTTDVFLYDGAGNRVAQQVTVGGSITTTTTYVARGTEEIVSGSSGTTLTKYFSGTNGLPTAERVGTGGPLSYLATDGQGTVSESFDGSGSVTSQQLYDPYGNGRYMTGTSPTSLGYTGQRADQVRAAGPAGQWQGQRWQRGHHRQRHAPSLIFENDEAHAMGCRWALCRDGPARTRTVHPPGIRT